MSEYYGAPNDFRNYLKHADDDRLWKTSNITGKSKEEYAARQYLKSIGLLDVIDNNRVLSVNQYRQIIQYALQKNAAAIRNILSSTKKMAPYDFIKHRMDDPGKEQYRKPWKGTTRSTDQKNQTAQEIAADRAEVQKFRDAEKTYLGYKTNIKYARYFANVAPYYTTARDHIKDAINANRALTGSEKTAIRQFVDKVNEAKREIARANNSSREVSGGSRY